MPMSIGDRIKKARKDAKITQDELAQRIGVDQSSVSDLERGKTSSTALVASYARALGVNPYWLETGKGLAAFAPSAPLIELSPQESELIQHFRQMSEDGKEIALRSITVLSTIHPSKLALRAKS